MADIGEKFFKDKDEEKRRKQQADYKTLDAAELRAMDDKALAAWQVRFKTDQPQHVLAEHEWRRRITDRQIAAAHKTARRAALWGAISGIIGTLAGGLLAWLLSGEQPPRLHKRTPKPVKAQDEATVEANQKNKVSAPPKIPDSASPTIAPKQGDPNHNP